MVEQYMGLSVSISIPAPARGATERLIKYAEAMG